MRTSTLKIAITFLFALDVGLSWGQVPEGYYQIKQGDTLAHIATDNGISPSDLIQWNKITSPSDLTVGQLLSIRPPTGSLSTSAISEPSFSVTWPLKGKVVANFSETKNKGIDISGLLGATVSAAADGTVVYVGSGISEYGNLVIIKHDKTYLTAYAYNKAILVNVGEVIHRGQKIAEVGQVNGSEPRLHFEVRVNGTPVNPEPFLSGHLADNLKKGSDVSSMNDAMDKCMNLGFKKDTEALGKCTLRLSR